MKEFVASLVLLTVDLIWIGSFVSILAVGYLLLGHRL